MSPPRLHRRTVLALGVLAVLLAVAADAFARGGGGGNFGGGGDGGGWGGGGGGGDGGGDITWLIVLIVRYPAVGIPVAILLVALVVLGGREGRRHHQGSAIRNGKQARRRLDAWEAEQRIRATDPEFDKALFSGRVVVAFRKVQAAWCAQDLGPVRPFVSDGIHERFALQLAEQRDLGYRDRMDDLDVRSVDFAEVVDEGRLQIVTVRVRARAKDYRVDLQSGRPLSGDRGEQEFVEYWSFLRRRGATSRGRGNGLIEGCCGNCGAPVAMSQWAKCEHCSAFLRSGEHDWVLAEITQESEWEASEPDRIHGVRELRGGDPGFSVQNLEDRVSVMFWRAAMSERLGDVTPLRKMASDALCERWERFIREGVKEDGRRWYFGERGVGAVRVLGVFRADSGRDAAVAEVTWSGTMFSVSPAGERRRERKSGVVTTLLQVERNAGVQSDAGAGVSSAHCPGCGAPDAGGETDACEYCGEVMNDGKRDWVLVDIVARHTDEGRALLARMRGPLQASLRPAEGARAPEDAVPCGRMLVAWLVHAGLADGRLDERELARLTSIAERAGVRRAEIDGMIAAARAHQLDLPRPLDLGEARRWLDQAAAVALADGHLTHGEEKVLVALGSQAGLAAADVRYGIATTRKRLLGEAKTALRDARRIPRADA